MDGWTVIAYNLSDSHSAPIVPTLFCVTLVFMGAFFLLNLFLAVVMESYLNGEEKIKEEESIALKKEKEELKER